LALTFTKDFLMPWEALPRFEAIPELLCDGNSAVYTRRKSEVCSCPAEKLGRLILAIYSTKV
jgi:hypothetical protein